VRPLDLRWLGSTSYPEAARLQERLVAARRGGEIPDTLLLLEHPPVITFGRGADPGHVLAEERELAHRGIEIHDAGRGGDVTYHGPGQLVGYPIVALEGERRDAHAYLRAIEQALIEAVAEFGITAGRVDGLTGVWVGDEKLAAIGVRLSTGWITSHGFALNVRGDLSGFDTIVPCGIRDRGVTSIARLTDRDVTVREAAESVAPHVARELGLRASESMSKIGEAS
jgi:lipoyl(octanoyl) transferase